MKLLQQLVKIINQEKPCLYEEVWCDMNDNILNEAAVRMFKRIGREVKRRYRCTTGPRKGKPVADPKLCATRIDPKKKRHGRKVARTRKGIRIRKTKITNRTSMSRMVRRMNQRLKGARSAGTNRSATSSSSNTKSKSTKKTKKTK